MKKRLITSALPYVNNVPHLGNLIQVLSADVFARWCRLYGYETLYICGTDEYGTATETRAMEEGISPKELCDRYHKVHKEIYDWFEISFDHFGRTSAPVHTKITQDLFLDNEKAGFIIEEESQQIYCPDKDMFLADRFVRGTCPHCGYKEARGDQCENCGKLLDPTDLINPYSPLCPGSLTVKPTKHLYINLPEIKPFLEEWIQKTSLEGFWSTNAIKMTEAWIRDGLKPRAITRDLRWGIPVPKQGYEKKVFYVWFDAPIGYISITADHTPDWKKWWQNPDEVELYQFIGKDNIPFHTVVFPCTLLGAEKGSGVRWTKLFHMSATEYLNYESGKFSKSQGVGVFGNDAIETGIPADVWRFYLFYNRPETSDTLFAWKDFAEKVNSELIGNFGNLVNRTLLFILKNFDSLQFSNNDTDWNQTRNDYLQKIKECYERADLRDALKLCLEWSALGNKRFQEFEPWKIIKENPEKTLEVVSALAMQVRDLAILLYPIIPVSSTKVLSFFGYEGAPQWSWIEQQPPRPSQVEILFQKLEKDQIEGLRLRYAGKQNERTAIPEVQTIAQQFIEKVQLIVARITKVERHPSADKLYIEEIDLGPLGSRTIVSGLVPYYKEEELLGKNIIVVANLKAAKLRGVLSQGMLLAASANDQLEVLTVEAPPGTPVLLASNKNKQSAPYTEITVDEFFAIPLKAQGGKVVCDGRPLLVNNIEVTTKKVRDGEIG